MGYVRDRRGEGWLFGVLGVRWLLWYKRCLLITRNHNEFMQLVALLCVQRCCVLIGTAQENMETDWHEVGYL